MLKPALALSALILFPAARLLNPAPHPAGVLQDAPAAAATPIAADTKNPVKPTPESQAKAKKMYTYDCAMCHNDNGDGKSDLAKDMSLTMSDLTDPKTLGGKSDADLYNLIKDGKGKMPPEDASRAKPDAIWNLVLYVRGLAKN
jgi:mono/diheme cytochrome c family protein